MISLVTVLKVTARRSLTELTQGKTRVRKESKRWAGSGMKMGDAECRAPCSRQCLKGAFSLKHRTVARPRCWLRAGGVFRGSVGPGSGQVGVCSVWRLPCSTCSQGRAQPGPQAPRPAGISGDFGHFCGNPRVPGGSESSGSRPGLRGLRVLPRHAQEHSPGICPAPPATLQVTQPLAAKPCSKVRVQNLETNSMV